MNLNKNKNTPLHIALKNNCIKIGELLISKGADINAIDIISQITENHFYKYGSKLKKKI